jgi:hypothetical protein
MKRSSRVVLASSSLLLLACVHAADATSPVDFTQRNAPFAPGLPIPAEKNTPAINRGVQDRRVEAPTVEKPAAAAGEKRAAIDVTETRDKTVRDNHAQKPEAAAPTVSTLDHRASAIATTSGSRKPALIAKYQDEMAAASAYTMATYPAMNRATTAKINRFVFRKNNPEPLIAPEGAAVTPAAGGAPIRK